MMAACVQRRGVFAGLVLCAVCRFVCASGSPWDLMARLPASIEFAVVVDDGTDVIDSPAGRVVLDAVRRAGYGGATAGAWSELAQTMGLEPREAASMLLGRRAAIATTSSFFSPAGAPAEDGGPQGWLAVVEVDLPTLGRLESLRGAPRRLVGGVAISAVEFGRYEMAVLRRGEDGGEKLALVLLAPVDASDLLDAGVRGFGANGANGGPQAVLADRPGFALARGAGNGSLALYMAGGAEEASLGAAVRMTAKGVDGTLRISPQAGGVVAEEPGDIPRLDPALLDALGDHVVFVLGGPIGHADPTVLAVVGTMLGPQGDGGDAFSRLLGSPAVLTVAEGAPDGEGGGIAIAAGAVPRGGSAPVAQIDAQMLALSHVVRTDENGDEPAVIDTAVWSAFPAAERAMVVPGVRGDVRVAWRCMDITTQDDTPIAGGVVLEVAYAQPRPTEAARAMASALAASFERGTFAGHAGPSSLGRIDPARMLGLVDADAGLLGLALGAIETVRWQLTPETLGGGDNWVLAGEVELVVRPQTDNAIEDEPNPAGEPDGR